MKDLATLTDDEFVDYAEKQIWLSAFASNNPRSKYHGQADACYDEAQRREKPWLYGRAYVAACRSCGYEPTPSDLAVAKAPAEQTGDVP